MEDDMQARMFFPASIALAVLVAGCAPATPPAAPDTRDADAKAIRQLEADWSQSFATKDLGKVTAFYADDASLFNTGMPVVTGKANIANIWKQYLADKNFSLTFAPDKVVVSKSGDMGSTQGSYTLTYTDPKTKRTVMEKGKYVEVYMKQADGSWKNTADISNTDEPVAPVKK
jgi:uncharacterized protein (TIGR02246 family)